MSRPHRVVLVRERAAGAGTGCCGGTELFDRAPPPGAARVRMESMGAIYRALRTAMPDVDVQVVEPRNTAWLVPVIWRDARRRGLARASAWEQVRRGVGDGAIIADGLVVASGLIPEPEAAVLAVRDALVA